MKKVLGIGLSFMVALASACGGGGDAISEAQTTSISGDQGQTSSSGNMAESELQVSSSQLWEDMAEIEVMYASMGAIPNGLQAVEDEINKITEQEINTHVHLNVVEMGSYVQQTTLMMSSGQQVDLMMFPYGAASFAAMQAQGQWMDITDLLNEYAEPTLDLLGDLVKGTSVHGRIYGLSGYRNLASGEYIVMRTDVLEDLGLLEQAEQMTTYDEFENILEAVASSEKWGNLASLASGGNGSMLFLNCLFDSDAPFNSSENYDTLGSTGKLISAKFDNDELIIGLSFDMPEYRKMYERVRSWYEKGYIYKDVATTQDAGSQLVRSGAVFSYITGGEYGIEASHSENCGMPVTCVLVQEFPITTSQNHQFGWGVPTISKYPEAAVAFLNMMYTDTRIANLLAWGIEGVDYQVKDGIAYYIEGNETPQYHTNDFFYGNQFNVLPWDGTNADFRENSLEAMENAEVSQFMGFVCDTSSVTEEIAAVTNCLNEYQKIVDTGVVSEEQYEEFINKLHSVGADKILECYQQQLQTWLEENQ